MRHRYSAFDPRRHARQARFEQLRKVFELLLTKTGAQVDEAFHWLEHLGARHGWFDEDYGPEDFRADLQREGTIRTAPRGAGATFQLTPKGERQLRQSALERAFDGLAKGGGGEHATPHSGGFAEVSDTTRPFAYGDPLDRIAWTSTLKNALGRTGGFDPATGGFSFREEDFEVQEHEADTSCATVLLIDISHSMVLYGEDRMLPARETAMALTELVRTRYRRDTLDVVLFGDEAHRVPPEDVPYIQAGPFHTNTKAGLQMAQDILRSRKNVNKRIFMITDGKPSMIWRDGELYKNPFGLDDEIRNRTLDEALKCRRAGIGMTTFMVASDPILVEFIEEFSELAQGRAYFTGTDGLSANLFVDFLRNRRQRGP